MGELGNHPMSGRRYRNRRQQAEWIMKSSVTIRVPVIGLVVGGNDSAQLHLPSLAIIGDLVDEFPRVDPQMPDQSGYSQRRR